MLYTLLNLFITVAMEQVDPHQAKVKADAPKEA